MSNDLLDAIKFIFARSWKFFTETNLPGTDFSIGALFIGVLLVDFGLRFLGWCLGAAAPDAPEKTVTVRSPGLVPVHNELRKK